MTRKVVPYLLVCGLGLAGPLGCASSRLQPMDTTLFVPPVIGQSPDVPIEAPKASIASEIQPGPLQGESPKNASILPPIEQKPFDTLKPLDELPASPTTAPSPLQSADAMPVSTVPPTTQPDAGSTAAGQGVYMTLGGVLAQVNNTPIYANQVLSPLKKEFAAKAREMDSASFHDFAEQEIAHQLDELIKDELYFATAYQALSTEDRQLAEGIVGQVRHEKVIAAGGSESVARQRALDDGEEFDESLKAEYRRVVSGLYQRRRIDPLVQVTADQMREFYRLNLPKLFSTKDCAQFRVLEINPDTCGGKQAAMDKITALRERAVRGEDFASLASAVNDDDYLKGRGGNPCDDGGWMERGTYRIDEVEAAVWKIQPGQITPVIEANHALYIAKLEARKNGVIKPFDDEAVQERIYGELRQRQLANLWSKTKDDSISDAMINTDNDRLQVAVDMAMQKYAQAK